VVAEPLAITQRLAWLARTPGCGAQCGDRFGHDPATHEAYGAEQERVARARVTGVTTGILTVDLAGAKAIVDGREIFPSARPWAMLALLASRVGEIVSYNDIVRTVWGDGWLSTPAESRHNISITANRLRGVLGEAGPLLVTRPNVGLGLIALPIGDMSGLEEQASCLRTRWALRWDACRRCERTDRSHEGWGYCSSCVGTVRRQRGLS